MKRFLVLAVISVAFFASSHSVFADEATTTPELPSPTPPTATMTIRIGDMTAFTGVVELAASTTPPVDIAPTNSSSTVPVPADSLLATLVALDATTTDFEITDLGYFSSFNSFIVNCISVPADSAVLHCFNWTYAVNGTFPQVGIDHAILQDGDIVHLFFGPPRQTVLSTTTVTAGEAFTATAQRYDLDTGVYVGAAGVTLGVGTSNPDFSFTELATSTSDQNGGAIFTLNATGTFSVGIQEDFYFPSASITIIDATATTTEEAAPPVDNPPPTGGGIIHTQLNVQSALAYLMSKQHEDGSFDSPLLSDWAAFAFAARDPGNAKTKLREYLLGVVPALSSITDYERHAMALMAIDINPYSGTPTDYITPIVNAFDGTQIGDANLDNDDIFALFPLLHAGYSSNDDIIQKTTAFIVSRQQADGAWDSSIDVTAAAMQALSQVTTLPDTAEALAKADQYLHSQQQSNGGWGNSFSTSWALQAIAALNESPINWQPSIYNPNDYLASLQQNDGGMESTSSSKDTRIWATEYAIPAALGKTWGSLLQSFPKPTISTRTSAVTSDVTSITATSTPNIATSTPTLPISSSTPIVGAVAGTSTATTTTESKPLKIALDSPKKTPAVHRTIATTAPQQVAQAAAASVQSQNFLTRWWSVIASFLSRLL